MKTNCICCGTTAVGSQSSAWLCWSRCAGRVVLAVGLLLPAIVQAQYAYATNHNAITITRCSDSEGVGAMTIPDQITGLPVTCIGDTAFNHCVNMTSIAIPNSVTTIGAYAFLDCAKLTSVSLPSSVTTIGDRAFADCFHLTSLTLPDSITAIGQLAFDVTSLTNVTLPSRVTTIEDGLFFECANLTTVTIPSSVTTIKGQAFTRCKRLASLYFRGNAPRLVDDDPFVGANQVTIYHLPDTTGWGKKFGGRPTAVWTGNLP